MIINPYIFGGFDPDAQAFITAANITDNTQKTAINQLVLDLKAYNIWSKMKAIYPFVGGTASTHKFNLKDPRDLDAAFRLVFNGGWTHSSTGALPNGTNGYADTYLTPSSILTNHNIHISHYSRTQNTSSNRIDIGGFTNSSSNYYSLWQSDSTNGKVFTLGSTSNLVYISGNTNTLGYMIGSRTSNNLGKGYFNGTILGTTTNIYTGSLTPFNLYISALNNNNSAIYFSPRQVAFATIGDGLTDTDATNLSWITEQYQTTLGRSVNPWYNNGNLLLDNYPSAAVAYSVRKLRNYYIGAAIRVRRSSDNAEQDIFFDSTGNLDTASLLSFVGAGNGFVTTWYDQSGNGRNATQTTAANQPQIVSSGSLILQNGKAAISSNQKLLFTDFNYTVTSQSNFVVSYVNSSTVSYGRILTQGTTTNDVIAGGYIQMLRYYTDNALCSYTNIRVSLVYTLLNKYCLFNSIHSGTVITNTLNNSSTGTDNHNLNVSFNRLCIGDRPNTGEGFTGNIQEVIVYNNINQTSNRTAIESNINSYYTIWSSGPTWDGSQSGMLNTYSGAAVAYSVRALNSAYTGPLIRVRRSSDNAEIDIFALYNGELDTTFLLNFVGAGNGFVTTWYDQSGNGRNATQTTAANQPRIVNAGVLETQNSKPSMYFDGTNDKLINLTSISYTNFTLFSTNRFYRVQTTGEIVFQYSKLDIAQGGVGFQSSDTGISPIASYSFNDVGTSLLRLHNHLSTVSGATTTSTLFLNNIQKATGSKNLTSSKTTFAIGGPDSGTFYFAQIGISEIVLYPSDQSTNRTIINANINSYFNIYP